MRKTGWLLIAAMVLLLAACGEKTQEEVVEDLEETLQGLDSYKAEAVMVLETGQEPREYDVNVWHEKTDSNQYYRVELKNENEEQNQLILRNDDGVFVLTPALNKRFRFQSDWPNNNSQVYLYESLVSDILMDAERTFAIEEDQYVFETKTHYQNNNLHSQDIKMSADDLSPASVQIYDPDDQPLVTVEFSSFETDVSFEDGAFEMERNMTEAEAEDVAASADEVESGSEDFEVHMPLYEPQGTTLEDSEERMGTTGKKAVLSYGGEMPFTIVQQAADVVETSAPVVYEEGQPVDLGYAHGVYTGEALHWTYEGIEYMIAGDEMPVEEMEAVARSMTGTHAK
nr:outer membrane lipoprotein carrier protein LolA [Salsuginibacillus halophilus]